MQLATTGCSRVLVILLFTCLFVTPGFAQEPPATQPVVISIDASRPIGPISPFIYGVNFCDWEKMPSIPFSRQGGNRMTAWNWETNASNAGNDWHHQNDDYLGGGDKVGEVARAFVAPAMQRGKSVVVTVPMAGYVAADKNPPGDVNQTPDYLNVRFDKSVAKKNAPFSDPPDLNDKVVYQDEFVWWLNKQFPVPSRHGGQIFYDLDNEPDIWASTHARIHPKPVTYAELVQRTTEYASAIKDVDPNAVIFGFVSYGFNGYRTLQNAPDGNGRDFIDFFLDSMRDAEKTAGRRLVDVLDLHWYTEVQGNGKRVTQDTHDEASARARVQAPRSLWDPSYTEKSWITDAVTHGPIELIPTIKAKIEKHYPGTKLAFTEYDYGGATHISGAIAQADALGIFGQQGVFAAAHWGDLGTFLAASYDCYLNYDGKGGHFGDVALQATSSDLRDVSVYASKFDQQPDRMVVVLINRSESARTCRLEIGSFPVSRIELYRLSAQEPKIKPVGVAGAQNIELPSMSVTTAVISR